MGDETSEEILPKLQALHDQFELAPADLKFILEHIALCQQRNTDIRWDLVQSMFFADEQEVTRTITYNDSFGAFQNASTPSETFPGGPPCVICIDEEENDEMSPRESLQDVILQLCERSEEGMASLPEADRRLRRRVLMELLLATNDEEWHQSTVSLDDLVEIAYHVNICEQAGVPIEWELINTLVIPLSGSDVLEGSGEISQSPSDTLASGLPFQLPFSPPSENPARRSILPKQLRPIGSNRDDLHMIFGLSQDEIEILLSHIRNFKETEIRWDLIGKVLFPQDRFRRKLFARLDASKRRRR